MVEIYGLSAGPVEHVVVTRDLKPARIIAPDPRWFALHKLWMSAKPTRSPQKQPKDRKQGRLLLTAIAEAMPHYPLDEAFVAELPSELLPHFEKWRARLKCQRALLRERFNLDRDQALAPTSGFGWPQEKPRRTTRIF